MNVICFGDSNTYGYDPRGYFGGRYDADCRWVDILAAETGWTVSNLGQNGREIPSSAPAFPAGTDLLIVMLGTNDLLQRAGPGAGRREAGAVPLRHLPGSKQDPADRTAAGDPGRMGPQSAAHRRLPRLCPALPGSGGAAGHPLCRRRKMGHPSCL